MELFTMHGMILWIIAKLYESHCPFAFNKSGHLHLTTYHGFLQTGYSVVAASVVALRLKDKASSQTYADMPGFSCPGVPVVPTICIFFNMFLFAQLHHEAWVRFVILSIITVGIYAFYGQYHADPSADETIIYHRAPEEDSR
ncbi:hypothetical protein ACLB2K_073892 [Fragaria x ananassa]